MSDLKRRKRALICSTALIGGGLLNPTAAFAVSCPSSITGTALAGVNCDFDSGASVTVNSVGEVGGISMNAYFPASSFILNNGTITDAGNSVGILIRSSALTDGITNNGTITASTGGGIRVENTSTISGGITNNGTISAQNESLYITSSTISGDISNIGTAMMSSANGDVFVVTNGSRVTGGLINSGTISATNVFAAIVINNSSTINGAFTNSGIINSDMGAAFLARSNSLIAGGFTNSGSINSANHRAVEFLNFSNVSGNVTNETGGSIYGGLSGLSVHNGSVINGSIINEADATIDSGDTGIQIYSIATISGSIQNSGVISGTQTGISVLSSATIAGGISNSGTIQGGVYAINIGSGSVVNNIDLLGGSRIIGAINATSSDLTVHGNFQSEGTINVDELHVPGNFTANHNITASNVSVTSGGLFTLSAGKTVTGDVTANGGTFAVGVNNGTFGAVTGTVDLSNGTLAVDVESPLLQDGDVMSFAGSVVPPTGGAAISDNSYLFDFLLVGNAIEVEQVSASDLGFNRADTSTYNQLQGFAAGGTSNGTMLQTLGNLNSASSRQAAQNIVQSVEPTLNGSDLVGAQTINNQTAGIAGQQLAMLHGNGATGMAAGENPKNLRPWMQLFGAHASQDERGGISGYTANTWGGVFGMDTTKISDNAIVGVAFGYGRTSADSNNSNSTDTDIGSYQLTLYGDYALAKGTFLTGMLSYGWQDVDTARHDVGGISGLTARGNFNSNQYGARAELGKKIAYGSATLTPSFMASYLHYSPDSYTETGAGGANLTVDRQDMDLLEFGPRLTLSRAYQHENGVLTPSLHGGVRYDVIGDHLDSTNVFAAGGTAFDTRGIQPGRATADIGASLKYQAADSWEFSANYDFQYKSDYSSNAGYLKAVYKF